MPDDAIKYQLIRAQTEQRLAPMRRLHQRQFILLGLMLVYFLLAGITMALRGNVVYDLLMPLTWVLFALLFVQIVRFALDYHHESKVQRETAKAMELERLRLLYALASTEDALIINEKAKRLVSLSDDGELVTEDETHDKPVQHTATQQAK